MEMEREPDYVFKIAIIGDYAVGKTSLIGRFIQKQFITEYKPTLGVNLILKELNVQRDNKELAVNLVLWDIAGQDKYEKVRQLYYKGCSAAILVYDVTRVETFHNLKEKWIQDYIQNTNKEPVFIIVGNKNDLDDLKKVDDEDGEKLKKEISALKFFATSAKTGDNVDKAFMDLVELLLDKSRNKK
ncbi:MAG: Rab family GTPase [Promethearchaeota archaeon]